MNFTYELTLDINPAHEIPVVRVKQGDAYTRFLDITLTKDGETYTPESGVEITFRCQKPNGTCVFEDSAEEDATLDRYLVVDNGDGTVTVELVADVTSDVGSCRCDLCLYKDEQVMSSMQFIIQVFPSPVTNQIVYYGRS